MARCGVAALCHGEQQRKSPRRAPRRRLDVTGRARCNLRGRCWFVVACRVGVRCCLSPVSEIHSTKATPRGASARP
eukprot:scaffold45133_cov42-Phaeocystis_antarctica.AAC.2